MSAALLASLLTDSVRGFRGSRTPKIRLKLKMIGAIKSMSDVDLH
jgi:hypothetical protein